VVVGAKASRRHIPGLYIAPPTSVAVPPSETIPLHGATAPPSGTAMLFTTPEDLLLLSAQNAELRALLEETRQYLLRLPPVPVTLEFAARLDVVANKTDNTRAKRLAVGVLESAVREVTTLSCGEYMKNGVPLYSIRLEGRQLQFSSAGIKDGYPEASAELVKRIGEGWVIQLEPPTTR